MSKFADDLSRVLKYSTADWKTFQKLLTEQPHHRWGGPNADHTLRKVAADAYQEAEGDEAGADLLRNPDQHVVIDGGKVKKGRFNISEMRDWLTGLQRNIEDWANSAEPHGISHDLQEMNKDGTIRVDKHYARPLVRDHTGNGQLQPGVPDDSETYVTHVSKVGKELADDHEQALRKSLGWNERHTHTDWDETTWNDMKGSAEDAIVGLRNAPFEEIVPEGPK